MGRRERAFARANERGAASWDKPTSVPTTCASPPRHHDDPGYVVRVGARAVHLRSGDVLAPDVTMPARWFERASNGSDRRELDELLARGVVTWVPVHASAIPQRPAPRVSEVAPEDRPSAPRRPA
jgi:hypothetical protein